MSRRPSTPRTSLAEKRESGNIHAARSPLGEARIRFVSNAYPPTAPRLVDVQCTAMTGPAEQLATTGAVIFRGFLSPDDTANLRRTVDDIYACMGSCQRFSNRLFGENFRAWQGVWLKHLPMFLHNTRPDLEVRYDQSLRAIRTQVAGVLGRDWRFFAKRSYFRRHIGMAKKVPWHIDADAASIYRIAASVINVWLPLDAVGSDLPSLDIVPRSHAVMRRVPLLTGKDRYRDDAFAATIGEPSTPRLEPGDALIFDQFLLHRTQRIGSATAIRTACEFRFVRPSVPTLHGVSGGVRAAWNILLSSDGLLAERAKTLLIRK